MIKQSRKQLKIEVIIKSHYPCHVHKMVKLRCIVDDVPKMKFDRKCPACGREWMITVKQLSRIKDGFIHKLVWE